MSGPAAGPPAVVVRRARVADLSEIVDLLVGGSLVEGKEDPTQLDRYRLALAAIEAACGAVLVAEQSEGGAVVGVCQLIVFPHLQTRGGRCAELESLHVRADLRGGGIGGALLEAAAQQAEAAGCYRIQLMSNNQRVDAHRFYRQHGFVSSHTGFKRPLT